MYIGTYPPIVQIEIYFLFNSNEKEINKVTTNKDKMMSILAFIVTTSQTQSRKSNGEYTSLLRWGHPPGPALEFNTVFLYSFYSLVLVDLAALSFF